jgi:hypothetical protein
VFIWCNALVLMLLSCKYVEILWLCCSDTVIEEHILDTDAGKQLSYSATDV